MVRTARALQFNALIDALGRRHRLLRLQVRACQATDIRQAAYFDLGVEHRVTGSGRGGCGVAHARADGGACVLEGDDVAEDPDPRIEEMRAEAEDRAHDRIASTDRPLGPVAAAELYVEAFLAGAEFARAHR